MRVSDKAIVLQSIQYGDKKFILKLYTRNHVLLSVTAITGKKVKHGSILSLTMLDVELVIKQNKEIHQLTEAGCYYVYHAIPNSLSKLSIAQFLNELLLKALKEQGPNEHLFIFIETCLKFLNDSANEYINLHIYFLIELTKYLGFEPQNNFSPQHPFFDCREGRFSQISLSFPLGLGKEESVLFSEFLKINSLKVVINHSQRQALLEILLAYYKLHIPGFNEIKSLEVLRQVVL